MLDSRLAHTLNFNQASNVRFIGMKRLHIMGCPRSGTTMLIEMMASCFRMGEHAGQEYSLIKSLQLNIDFHPNTRSADIQHLHRALGADKDLFVIYIYRDPRAVVSSLKKGAASYFSSYPIWQRCEHIARELHAHERVLQIRFEDLVSYADIIQQVIQSRFPFLHQKYPFSQFAQYARPSESAIKAMNGLRAPDQSSLTHWRAHLPRVKAQLLRFPQMQEDLEYRNYERDASWQTMLAAVAPVESTARHSEHISAIKMLENNPLYRLYLGHPLLRLPNNLQEA